MEREEEEWDERKMNREVLYGGDESRGIVCDWLDLDKHS